MQPVYIKGEVLKNVKVSQGIYRLSIKGEYDAKMGQFYMLRAWDEEPTLPRPLSVHDVDKDSIHFLYEVKGRGTERLKNLKEGDTIELTGPLGNGFDELKIKGRVAIVSGGIGIAPMFYVAKTIKDLEVDFYAGFRDEIYTTEDIKQYVKNIYISTDGGRYGHKGYITDIFSESLSQGLSLNQGLRAGTKKYDVVLCCGPEIMMKKIVDICKNAGIPVYVSLESSMACGLGACLVCTCTTNKGKKRVCKDGPVFLGEDVVFHD